jgi:hypothetical protein
MAKHAAHGIVEEKPKKAKKQRDKGEKQAVTYRAKKTSHSSHKGTKEGSKGKWVIVFVAVVCVIVAVALGTGIYFKGLNNVNGTATGDTAVTNVVQETENQSELVVITVEGSSIQYNGEEIASAEILEEKIAKENNPTFSLINLSADADIYNSVATILNNHGAGYELMDENNTNPSISTTQAETETRSDA